MSRVALSPSRAPRRLQRGTLGFALALLTSLSVSAAEAAPSAVGAASAPRQPTLSIDVSSEVAALPGLVVTLDGVKVSHLGAGIPVSLGVHTLSASAKGKRTWGRKVEIREPGEIVQVTLKAMEALDPYEETAPGVQEGDPLLLPPARSVPDPVRRPLMWVTGGIALAGVALGSTFGGLTISTWGDVEQAAKDRCRIPADYKGCHQDVRDLQVRASSYATISTFSFIAGGAALVGTALLWLTTPRGDAPSSTRLQFAPLVGASATGALVQGVF